MKTRILISTIIVAFAGTLLAADDNSLSITESRIPNSPAFSLLGINPTAVEYPSSPMQLGASLAGALGSDNSGKFGNIAMEFSPFWWTKNSQSITYDTYYNIEHIQENGVSKYQNKSLSEQNIWKNFYQTLTFSLATTESDTLGNTNLSNGGTAVGFGFRSTLIKGKLPAKALASRLKVWELDERISGALSPSGDVPDALFNELLAAEKEYNANLEYLAGFQLEIAGGGSMDFLEGNTKKTHFRRAGAWMNASYRSDDSGGLLDQFAVLANCRYFYTDSVTGEHISSVDVGARITWISPNEKIPLSFSGEYVRRFNSGSAKDIDRLGIVATLKLSDRYSVYLSHGANIEKGVLSRDENMTYIGLNVLLGKAKAKH